MGQLGWVYLVGVFVQFSIAGRPVLLPFFAVAAAVYLTRLVPFGVFGRSRWFTLARVCAVVTAAASFASWIPALDLGACLSVSGVAMALGPGAYAGALRDWSVAQSWDPPAAKARAAQVLLLAVPAILAAGIAALVVFGDRSPASVEPSPSYTPSSVFGRPVEGWAPGIVLVVVAVILIAGLLKLRGASQLIRHSLRAQPDATFVEV